LRQRQPGRGPSPLEPGDGAADRRVLPPAHPSVQRLRGSGRAPVRRHGSQGQLLMAAVRARAVKRAVPYPWLKPAIFTGALTPLASLALRAARGTLSADPVAYVLNQFGLLTLIFLLA